MAGIAGTVSSVQPTMRSVYRRKTIKQNSEVIHLIRMVGKWWSAARLPTPVCRPELQETKYHSGTKLSL